MGNTLEQLDHFITETLKPENLKAAPLSEPQIQELIRFATAEEKTIRKKIQTGYINANSKDVYAHKLYAYQTWIITLSNTLSNYLQHYREYTQLYDHCLIILDNLIIFLEETFPWNFNYDLQVSNERKLIVIQDLKCRINNLQTLAKCNEIDSELVTIISEIIQDYFYNSNDYQITFSTAKYFNTLFKTIFEEIEYGPIEDKTQALISALHTANFNHTRFIVYLTRQVSKETCTTASKYVQIEKIYAFKMNLEQTPFGNPKVMLIPLEKEVICFESNEDYEGLKHITSLFNGIVNKRVFHISYQDFKTSLPYDITFHPYYLKQYNNRWFVFGYNPEKENHKWNLALDRIKNIEETKADYMESTIDWDDYFYDIVGVTRLEGEEQPFLHTT